MTIDEFNKSVQDESMRRAKAADTKAMMAGQVEPSDEEQMVMHTLMDVQRLLAAVRANPEKFIEHKEYIWEIGYDANTCDTLIKEEEMHVLDRGLDNVNKPAKALWFNECDMAAMQAKIKIAGL